MTTQSRMTVGIVVERRKAASPWIDFTWQAVGILPGQPDAAPWTVLSQDGECTTFYAGTADINLYRTESRNYQDNLTASRPAVWVALRPTDSDPPYSVLAATVDPAEGEAFTEAGNDLIDAVPMPALVREALEAFVAQNPAQQHFFKRKRERANPEALARRVPGRDGDQ